MLEQLRQRELCISQITPEQAPEVYFQLESFIRKYKRTELAPYATEAIMTQRQLVACDHVELSKFGSVITRETVKACSAEAYFLQFLLPQDYLPANGNSVTTYFHNPFELEIIGYLDGELTIYRCPTLNVFTEELAAIEAQ